MAEAAAAPPLTWRGRLPVTVIGGYLGAGKTTLVNALLRAADGRRLCVLVNDFGSVPIDRDLIVAAGGDTLELSGGCVCCEYGSDLIESLASLPARQPQVEHVLLETSGVALPGQVAASLSLLPGYRLDGVVVLADAETVRARADDRYLGDTIRRQLAAADLVIANRCDLAGPAARDEALRWLAQEVPAARLVATSRAAIAPELVLGLRDGPAPLPVPAAKAAASDAATLYDSVVLALPTGIDLESLARRLTVPALGVLRAKAIVADGGRRLALHVVGARAAIDEAPAAARSGALVAIGLRGQLDGAAIGRALLAAA